MAGIAALLVGGRHHVEYVKFGGAIEPCLMKESMGRQPSRKMAILQTLD